MTPPPVPPTEQQTPDQTDLAKFIAEETSEFLDFETAREKLDHLINEWSSEERETSTRRKMRDLEVDIEKLHQEGKLKADETFIGIRVIDSNIRKERPPYLNYLKQARRLMIFKPIGINVESEKVERLEQEFTEGMQYNGWELPFDKELDGAATHGWDLLEVEFDESKPLNVSIDHVGHENLILPLGAKSLQACERIIRIYDFTITQLVKSMQNHGFNQGECLRLIREMKDKKQHTVKIYKVLCKYGGQVYVKWYAGKESQTWLREPKPLFLGRKKLIQKRSLVPVQRESIDMETGMPVSITVEEPQMISEWVPEYETQYPIFLLPYTQTEKQCIRDYKGRVFLDCAKQEAQTALWSIFVNGAVRAGNVYGSPKNAGQTDLNREIKKLNLAMEHGCFYNNALEFWSPPYPNADLVRATQALDTQTQSENGQVAFAAVNRQDSRKTATEVSAAQQQNASLSTVDVILFSVHVREVYSFVWLIVQSQAIQGLVTLCRTESQTDMMGNTTLTNDVQFLSQKFITKAAGDYDVIQRAEKLQRRLQFWPVIVEVASSSPAAMMMAAQFFLDMVSEAFPEDAIKYKNLFEQGKQMLMMQQQQQLTTGVQGESQSNIPGGDSGQQAAAV